MAVDSNIGSLPAAASIEDDSLLVAEQQGEAKHFTGKQLKDYAKSGVAALVAAAQKAADDAAQAARDAKAAADSVQDVSDDAEAAIAAAQAATQAMLAAQNARDAARAAAETAAGDAAANVENRLKQYVSDAQSAKGAAEQAAENAAADVENLLQGYVNDAQQAKTGAETAAGNAAANVEEALKGYVSDAQTAQIAAEQAAENAAAEAVQQAESQLEGYVSDAEQAKEDAQSAAGTAATDAANAVNSQLAQHVADAQAAQKAAEQARDQAQAIAGGDFMERTTYDPQGKKTDIFKYVDEKLKDADFDVTADEVTFADGETFQQKYDNGELKGEDGNSGVYVGSGDMPDGYNVQIDPDSEGETLEDMIESALQENVGLFKGDKGDPGAPGKDGNVAFDNLTDGQKSQLTAGITEDLAESFQSDLASTVKISPSGMFAQGATAEMVSLETFTMDTLKNFTVIDKCAVVAGNYYARGTLVALRKDDKNYLSLSIVGYNGYLENCVAGVKNTKTYTNMARTITPASDLCSKLDLVRKKVELQGLVNGALTTFIDEDISSYDLSHLDTFNLVTGAGKYTGLQTNIYARINDYFDYTALMQQHFRMSDYNALPVLDGVKAVYEPTAVNLGGTITSTISETHKISNASMAADNYFAMQPVCSDAPIGAKLVTRFRVTSKSADTAFRIGAGSSEASIVDENGVHVWNGIGGFSPEVGKWYYLATVISGSGAGYASAYGMRAVGTFTIEAEALYAAGVRSQNMCAETWNGKYFTGALPFAGTNVVFTAFNDFNGTHVGKFVPIGATTIGSDGAIYMYNGSAWRLLG